MKNGKLIFSKIDKLPDDWWDSEPKNDPAAVWTVWDENDYYLWGANSSNYEGINIGDSLNGDGMAGDTGPTLGRAHPHYVGIITMSKSDLPLNDKVFTDLENNLKQGKNVVIPTFHGKFSLGTGIGSGVSNWGDIQKYLLEHIYNLGKIADTAEIPDGTFFPDCRQPEPYPEYEIKNLDDLMTIVNDVLKAKGDE